MIIGLITVSPFANGTQHHYHCALWQSNRECQPLHPPFSEGQLSFWSRCNQHVILMSAKPLSSTCTLCVQTCVHCQDSATTNLYRSRCSQVKYCIALSTTSVAMEMKPTKVVHCAWHTAVRMWILPHKSGLHENTAIGARTHLSGERHRPERRSA